MYRVKYAPYKYYIRLDLDILLVLYGYIRIMGPILLVEWTQNLIMSCNVMHTVQSCGAAV